VLKDKPETAFETAYRMAQVVKTLVARPMQVAIVNGLNRKLKDTILATCVKSTSLSLKVYPYNAAIARLLHLFSLRGDLKSLAEPASPDSAMIMRALALKRSTIMYKMCVKIG
jgi:hypothetical protein